MSVVRGEGGGGEGEEGGIVIRKGSFVPGGMTIAARMRYRERERGRESGCEWGLEEGAT